MFQSIRHSQIALRVGLALVFLWFGMSKFIMPQYWIEAWMPQAVQDIVTMIRLTPKDFIFLNGILEILIAVSLLTGFFTRIFSVVAIGFLLSVLVFNGLGEATVRDLGLIGGFVALLLWPERTYI